MTSGRSPTEKLVTTRYYVANYMLDMVIFDLKTHVIHKYMHLEKQIMSFLKQRMIDLWCWTVTLHFRFIVIDDMS